MAWSINMRENYWKPKNHVIYHSIKFNVKKQKDKFQWNVQIWIVRIMLGD